MARVKGTDAKCRDIITAIVNRCNALEEKGIERIAVGFTADWGGNSLTVHDGEYGHSHVGPIGLDQIDAPGSFDELVDQLHDLLVKGRGLSFELPPTTIEQEKSYGQGK